MINVEKEKVDRDIRLHVRSCLSNDRQLKKWKQSVKDEIDGALTPVPIIKDNNAGKSK
jgi:hypothetical protein